LQGELALTPANSAAIAEICQLLEGIPLAIELAATWVRTLSCAEIAAEIGRSLDFLSLADHDQPAAHQSMRAVFERSWSLLPADQQQVLARLSLFHGGLHARGGHIYRRHVAPADRRAHPEVAGAARGRAL